MQELLAAAIWVIGEKDRNGKFRGMNKVLGFCKAPSDPGVGPVFYLCAGDAFAYWETLDPVIRAATGVFEIPISRVFELASAADEGISFRA